LTTINSSRFKFIWVFIEPLSARHKKAGALVDIEESLKGIDRVAQTQNAIAARVLTPAGRLRRSKLLAQFVEPRVLTRASLSAKYNPYVINNWGFLVYKKYLVYGMVYGMTQKIRDFWVGHHFRENRKSPNRWNRQNRQKLCAIDPNLWAFPHLVLRHLSSILIKFKSMPTIT